MSATAISIACEAPGPSCADLPAATPGLALATDSEAATGRIGPAFAAAGSRARMMLAIDSCLGREGVTAEKAPEVATAIHSLPGVEHRHLYPRGDDLWSQGRTGPDEPDACGRDLHDQGCGVDPRPRRVAPNRLARRSTGLVPSSAHRDVFPGHGRIDNAPGWVIERISEEHGWLRWHGQGALHVTAGGHAARDRPQPRMNGLRHAEARQYRRWWQSGGSLGRS